MSETDPIRVIAVDDHQVVRGGIKYALLDYDDIELVAEAYSGQDAVRLCQQARPDVVLMDLMMPGMDGVEATRAIRERYPNVQILVLTSFHDKDLVPRAMQAGAIGYLVMISTLFQAAPQQVTALAGSGIEKITDIEGRSVAYPTGAAQAPQMPLLFEANNIDVDSVERNSRTPFPGSGSARRRAIPSTACCWAVA